MNGASCVTHCPTYNLYHKFRQYLYMSFRNEVSLIFLHITGVWIDVGTFSKIFTRQKWMKWSITKNDIRMNVCEGLNKENVSFSYLHLSPFPLQLIHIVLGHYSYIQHFSVTSTWKCVHGSFSTYQCIWKHNEAKFNKSWEKNFIQ